MWVIRVFAVLFIFGLLGWLYSGLPVKATRYELADSRIESPVSIVFLSDLHSAGVADGRPDLVRTVSDQKPDIIALVGDILDDASTGPEREAVVGLVAALAKVAPVYYSLGNDELDYMRRNGRSVLGALSAAGAMVLDETHEDVDIRGSRLRLGGMYALAFRQSGRDADWPETARFLSAFENTDAFKILLCHRPDSFIFNNASQDWEIDLLLTGHSHGGLVRLPLVGGLFSAGQGLFPKYDYGRYRLDDLTMIITSGLSGYKRLPRIWNRREIAVLRLVGA